MSNKNTRKNINVIVVVHYGGLMAGRFAVK